MNKTIEDKEWIFGLDIGTRNVVGVLGYEEGERLHIMHTALIEHKTRAMLDGQIHDVSKVTEVIKGLKEQLEEMSHLNLKEVAIAAAGRVLKTKISEAMIEFTEDKKIIKSYVDALELQGVESAKQMLYDEIKGSLDYYCVAYSPIKYSLDGYNIENLQGHRGRQMKATIIATFLPKQVIDSLYSAVEGAGLKVSHLTLEPISAINVSIPKEIRMLNLALVDIGAGTSDIAITKEGSIIAYGMLPTAGDEFSEKLIDEYLINFNTAEKIKKSLTRVQELSFVDILGLNQTVNSNEVLCKLDEVLQKLTDDIATRILELNGDQSPRAVFCVGGGSQFPMLTKSLSEKLTIPEERVIVKDISTINEENLCYDIEVKGPEFITPVGICLTAWMNKKSSFIHVTVNGNRIKLLNTKTLTVMDATIKSSYSSNNFIQKNGRDLEFTFNNQAMKIKGELGSPAEISINGKTGSLMSEVKNGDIIVLTTARIGKNASITAGELVEEIEEKIVYFGGKPIDVKTFVRVNGIQVISSYQLSDGDFVTSHTVNTLEDLLDYLNIKSTNFVFFINESIVQLNAEIHDRDSIKLMSKIQSKEEKKELENDDFIIYFNEKPIALKGKESYIFVHIFNYIDFDINQGKGNLVLKLNGNKAKYTDSLKPQDKIEIYWENV